MRSITANYCGINVTVPAVVGNVEDEPRNRTIVLFSKTCMELLSEFFQKIYSSPKETESTVFSVIYACIAALGLLGNGLVIFVVLRKRAMQTSRNVYILNLAISNFILSILVYPFLWIPDRDRSFQYGSNACKLITALPGFNIYCSTLTIAIMSIDRYYAARIRSNDSQRKNQVRYSVCISLIIWIVSISLSTPLIVFYDTTQYPPHWINMPLAEGGYGTFSWSICQLAPAADADELWQISMFINVLQSTFLYVVPLFVIVLFNVKLSRYVTRNMLNHHHQLAEGSLSSNHVIIAINNNNNNNNNSSNGEIINTHHHHHHHRPRNHIITNTNNHNQHHHENLVKTPNNNQTPSLNNQIDNDDEKRPATSKAKTTVAAETSQFEEPGRAKTGTNNDADKNCMILYQKPSSTSLSFLLPTFVDRNNTEDNHNNQKTGIIHLSTTRRKMIRSLVEKTAAAEVVVEDEPNNLATTVHNNNGVRTGRQSLTNDCMNHTAAAAAEAALISSIIKPTIRTKTQIGRRRQCNLFKRRSSAVVERAASKERPSVNEYQETGQQQTVEVIKAQHVRNHNPCFSNNVAAGVAHHHIMAGHERRYCQNIANEQKSSCVVHGDVDIRNWPPKTSLVLTNNHSSGTSSLNHNNADHADPAAVANVSNSNNNINTRKNYSSISFNRSTMSNNKIINSDDGTSCAAATKRMTLEPSTANFGGRSGPPSTYVSLRSKISNRRRQRLLLLLSLMGVCYGVLWFPYTVLTALLDFQLISAKHLNMNRWMDYGCKAVSMVTICVNPFLYGFLNTRFQQEFRSIFNGFTQRLCHRSFLTAATLIRPSTSLGCGVRSTGTNNHNNIHHSTSRRNKPPNISEHSAAAAAAAAGPLLVQKQQQQEDQGNQHKQQLATEKTDDHENDDHENGNIFVVDDPHLDDDDDLKFIANLDVFL